MKIVEIFPEVFPLKTGLKGFQRSEKNNDLIYFFNKRVGNRKK